MKQFCGKIWKRIGYVAATTLSFLTTNPVHAAWVDYAGQVKDIWLYTGQDIIFIRFENQPSSAGNSTCNPALFGVSGTASRIDRIYSAALAARKTGENLGITIDDAGACVGGYVPVVRVRAK
ncbi:MAG: hypothetical protein ACFBZ9_04935 [Sphingomonadales bacterium]